MCDCIHLVEGVACFAAGGSRGVRRLSPAAAESGAVPEAVRTGPPLAGGPGGLHHRRVSYSETYSLDSALK